MKRIFLSLFISSLFLNKSLAVLVLGDDESSFSPQKSETLGKKFPNVCEVFLLDEVTKKKSTASGVLIDERVVLTAAHAFVGEKVVSLAVNFAQNGRDNKDRKNTIRYVESHILHPLFGIDKELQDDVNELETPVKMMLGSL